MTRLDRPDLDNPSTRQPGVRPRYRDRDVDRLRHPDENPYVVAHRAMGRPLLPADEAQRHRDRWDEEFGRTAPLHVEIGSGNGFFLSGMAQRHPDWSWLGLELRYKRVVLCAEKIVKAGVSNARIARYHAAFLDDLFSPGTLSGLYVNHPDPWPKEKHEGNRLISRWFMEDVVSLLMPGAWLRMKTDHLPNVERMIELLDTGPDDAPAPRLPLEVTGRGDDVTRTDPPWGPDVETNYQQKFRLRGLPVYAIELRRTDAPAPARITSG